MQSYDTLDLPIGEPELFRADRLGTMLEDTSVSHVRIYRNMEDLMRDKLKRRKQDKFRRKQRIKQNMRNKGK